MEVFLSVGGGRRRKNLPTLPFLFLPFFACKQTNMLFDCLSPFALYLSLSLFCLHIGSRSVWPQAGGLYLAYYSSICTRTACKRRRFWPLVFSVGQDSLFSVVLGALVCLFDPVFVLFTGVAALDCFLDGEKSSFRGFSFSL